MATLNLGAIRYNWKGAYNGSTAYVVNDVVSANGNSYICIQAGTGQAVGNATAYWNIMSSAGTNGTNGTDVGTTITTQGDILYRDGSGLQRLAKGTAGQVLKINTGATAPEWGTDAGGSILAVSHKMYGGTNEINTQNRESDFGNIVANSYEISQLTITMTPSSASSKFLWAMNLQACRDGSHVGIGWLTYQVAGGTEYAVTSSGTRGITFRYDDDAVGTSNAGNPSVAHQVMIHPNTTSAVTFRIRIASPTTSYPWYINRAPNNATDVDDGGYMLSTSTCMELEGSKSTKAVTTTNESKT